MRYQELLFSASVLGAAIAPGICASDRRFSSPELCHNRTNTLPGSPCATAPGQLTGDALTSHFWRFALATPLTGNHQSAKALTYMTTAFKISPHAGLADTLNGRCEAMTLPQYDGDLPPYRCTREAGTDRKGRRVCEAHSRTLHRLTFYDDAGVLHD
jgi:hypothetical protein